MRENSKVVESTARCPSIAGLQTVMLDCCHLATATGARLAPSVSLHNLVAKETVHGRGSSFRSSNGACAPPARVLHMRILNSLVYFLFARLHARPKLGSGWSRRRCAIRQSLALDVNQFQRYHL
jgi:hypothetical protein